MHLDRAVYHPTCHTRYNHLHHGDLWESESFQAWLYGNINGRTIPVTYFRPIWYQLVLPCIVPILFKVVIQRKNRNHDLYAYWQRFVKALNAINFSTRQLAWNNWEICQFSADQELTSLKVDSQISLNSWYIYQWLKWNLSVLSRASLGREKIRFSEFLHWQWRDCSQSTIPVYIYIFIIHTYIYTVFNRISALSRISAPLKVQN